MLRFAISDMLAHATYASADFHAATPRHAATPLFAFDAMFLRQIFHGLRFRAAVVCWLTRLMLVFFCYMKERLHAADIRSCCCCHAIAIMLRRYAMPLLLTLCHAAICLRHERAARAAA